MLHFHQAAALRKALLAALPAVLFAGAALPEATQLTEDASRHHAERALDLLLDEGDRPGAVAEALRGLPQPPEEADLGKWPDAWSALHRAMAARPVTAPLRNETHFFGTLSPDGTRALVSWGVDGSIDSDLRVGAMLVDPLGGTVIGTPILADAPLGEGYYSAAPVGFSADGRLGAVSLMNGQTVVLDGLTGAERLRVPGNALLPQFSPDGRYLLTYAMGGGAVWELASGNRVLALTDDLGHSFDWTHDGRILATRVAGSGTAEVLIYALDGTARTIVPRIDGQLAGMPVPSPTEPVFLIGTFGAEMRTRIHDYDGRLLAELPVDFGAARFVRDGTAIAVSDGQDVQRMSDAQVAVYSLTGESLAVSPSDHTPFDHLVYSPEGEIVGSLAGRFQTTYHGDGLPEGAALYDAAVALVGRGAVEAPEVVETPAADAASTGFAREAERLLLTGDRTGAMVAALKGLPEAPDDADFDRFEAAHLLLYRSVAARVLRLPAEPSMPAIVGPTGRVMAVSGERPRLYAMPRGTPVAELLRADGTAVTSTTFAHFTPDGALFALAESDGVTVHFFDAATGAAVHRVTVPVPDWQGYLDGYSTIIDPVGFSADGQRLLLRTAGGRHYVISLGIWSVAQLPLPDRRSFMVSWLPGGQFLVAERLREEAGPAAQVFIHDGAAMTPIFSLPRDPAGLRDEPYGLVASRWGNSIITADGGRTVVFDGEGKRRVAFSSNDGDGIVAYVRDGTAIAYRDASGTIEASLKVLSLETGEQVSAEFRDYPVFDQEVFDRDGG
ncbi:WD40 repeat domain-containing protein, partial [Poseidonocella sp. HB161398]|uniref:WD40 repeat domain-containing protein n=1 Tax=Poseidonocella sp. HB161398 TaxID=2320855 RepID=UPI001109836E